MTLNEQLTAELKNAMKAGDQKTVGLLRFMMSQIKNKSLENHAAGKPETLTDEEILDIFKREAKKRKESINLFTQGNRADLADKEKEELVMIEKYLPAQMSREQITAIVDEVLKSGATEFGMIMKEAMAKTKGQADGKLVSDVIKEKTK